MPGRTDNDIKNRYNSYLRKFFNTEELLAFQEKKRCQEYWRSSMSKQQRHNQLNPPAPNVISSEASLIEHANFTIQQKRQRNLYMTLKIPLAENFFFRKVFVRVRSKFCSPAKCTGTKTISRFLKTKKFFFII